MTNADRLNRPSNRTLRLVAALVAIAAATCVVTGNWVAAIGFGVLAALLAVHPMLRIAWYEAGYCQAGEDRARQHS